MYQSIGADEFEQLLRKQTQSVIDVREKDEFEKGHIEGAINLPLSTLIEGYAQIDKTKKHFVVCHAGSRAARACQLFSEKGYQITHVLGGMSAWRGPLT